MTPVESFEDLQYAVDCFIEGVELLDSSTLDNPLMFSVGTDIYCIQKVIVHEQH